MGLNKLHTDTATDGVTLQLLEGTASREGVACNKGEDGVELASNNNVVEL